MSIFKCKMCGGTLEINNNETVGVCEYCGTKQTLPKLDDDKKINLYDRANHFRRNNNYDKAMSIYENILNEDETDAEAYWSLVLCRYGIEYVEDPATHRRVPTINRAQFTSVFMDEDYKSAIEYADSVQKSVYEAEAKAIDEIQKGILEISQKEEPFDVFICYKETDANGRRTQDSVLANDLYYQLTQEGFKVFFSRITLEDKLGTAYEPYIFAALNSAKVMVVLGTKLEYFNAVWVKNEWSRYLTLIKNGAKKVLIPAYRDMDPYDLPEEFSHLQAQDMSKLGFMQDLIRGIKKIANVDKQKGVERKTVVVNSTTTNTAPLLKRAFMFLEDGEWQSADEYCEKVLDLNPENAEAYLGKLMSELRVKQTSMLKNCKKPFNLNNNYRKAYRFGDDKLKAELEGYTKFINERNENTRLEGIYSNAEDTMKSAGSKKAFFKAAELFESIKEFKNSKELAKQCREKGEEAYRNAQYDKAVKFFENAKNEADCKSAKSIFEELGDFKDSKLYLDKYNEKVEEVRKKIEEARENEMHYNRAMKIKNNIAMDMNIKIANLDEAAKLFESIPKWKDAQKQAEICREEIEKIKTEQKSLEKDAIYYRAMGMKNNIAMDMNKQIANLDEAAKLFESIPKWKDAKNQAELCYEEMEKVKEKFQEIKAKQIAIKQKEKRKRIFSISILSIIAVVVVFVIILNTVIIPNNKYNQALEYINSEDYINANLILRDLGDYKDSKQLINEHKIDFQNYISAGVYHTVALKSDGTVVTTGDNYDGQCNVSDWKDIVAVSAGKDYTVGLKSDGTVVATGDKEYGKCDVSNWKDIVAVSAGETHTVGLKLDGTVVTTGYNKYGQCDVSDWEDIVAISAGNNHTVGLKSDGKVVTTNDKYNVFYWYDIVAVSAGNNHTVGLKLDGTVVATSYRYVSDWKNIVAVSMGDDYTLDLKSDGTLVATGHNEDGQCDVSDWKDIVAVSAGNNHTVGLKLDGTVVATGDNSDGQCNVSDWRLW